MARRHSTRNGLAQATGFLPGVMHAATQLNAESLTNADTMQGLQGLPCGRNAGVERTIYWLVTSRLCSPRISIPTGLLEARGEGRVAILPGVLVSDETP